MIQPGDPAAELGSQTLHRGGGGTHAAARVAGWTANIIEQHADNRLIRPLEEYIGPPERPYVPVDKRG